MRTAIGRIYHFYAGVFHEWPALFLVNSTVFFTEVAYFMVFATLPLYLTGQLHAPAKAAGLVFSAFAIAETLGKTPAGVISDRWGRLRVVLIGLVLCAIAPVLMGVAPRWELFVFLRVFDGLGMAAVWPILLALIGVRVASGSRATALSTFNFAYMAGMGLGWIAGLEVGEWLGGGDNRQVFFISAAIFFVAILSVGVLSLVERGRRIAERASVDKPPPLWEGLKEVARSRHVLLHMLWIFALLQLAITMLAPVVTLYARDVLKMNQHDMVKLLLVPVIVMAALAIPLGRLADKIGRARAAQLGIAVAGLALLGVPLLAEPWQKQAMMALLGGCYAITAPAWLALTSELAPTGMQGAAMGAMNTAQGLGFCAGPLVGTALYDIQADAPFVGSAVVLLVAALAALLLVKAPKQKQSEDDVEENPAAGKPRQS